MSQSPKNYRNQEFENFATAYGMSLLGVWFLTNLQNGSMLVLHNATLEESVERPNFCSILGRGSESVESKNLASNLEKGSNDTLHDSSQ